MEVLAQAELQAKHYAEASAAADQALALDPKAFKALIYKGRAQDGACQEESSRPRTGSDPRLVLQGNRLDPQSPEPLDVLLSKPSSSRASTPPAQAVDGLLFAVDLVPQDDRPPPDGGRQLLREGRRRCGREG